MDLLLLFDVGWIHLIFEMLFLAVLIIVQFYILKGKFVIQTVLAILVFSFSLFEYLTRAKCNIFFFNSVYDEFFLGTYLGVLYVKLFKKG